MIEENIEGFTKFVTVCFEKNSQLKKHKVAYLNKVASIAICLNKHFENDKNKKVNLNLSKINK